MLKDYEHQTQYYETDQMGVIHHSNYIRWMEEARIDMLEQIGWGYQTMEEAGILSPVLEVSCQYKSMVHFGDRVRIHVWLKEYTGIRMVIGYKMYLPHTDQPCTLGFSTHCFLNREGRPLSLKRTAPELDQQFQILLAQAPAE